MARYCLNCKQNVNPARKGMGAGFVFLIFATIAMLAVGLFGGLAGIVVMGVIVTIMWVVYWLAYAAKESVCPLCKDKNWDTDTGTNTASGPPPNTGPDTGSGPHTEADTKTGESGGKTYNKWSHKPYHVLGMSLAGAAALIVIVGMATDAVQLTPEQRAAVEGTPLTESQEMYIAGQLNDCMLSIIGVRDAQTAEMISDNCHELRDTLAFDERRDNWEAAQP